ncbi:Purple acid phosphatase [Euphorbia peplus]|nr:Purple acid phosphatase [Euphorbia peplus]
MAAILYAVVLFLLSHACISNAGITSRYVRRLASSSDMPLVSFPKPAGDNAPEQVHITQGDSIGKSVIISWVNPKDRLPDYVIYWKHDSDCKNRLRKRKVQADTKTYTYYDYTSGYLHHATIHKLEYNTKYIYQLGNHKTSIRRFSFVTPPQVGPDVPITFGIIGDLGQTSDSNSTLSHYMANKKADAMLFLGDLSYADDHPNHDNRRWDTWGRFIEPSAAYQPWIWCAGNHELDFAPELNEHKPFKPYTHRYYVPFKASGSTSPLWYSIKRASAHIVVLSSYSAYGKYTPQYSWLEKELPKVNRTETPWLIVLLHSPWYNSNNYHYMEGETMRVQFEPWFVKNKVDLVLSGHVHSYERTERISNVKYNITNGLSIPTKDLSAPIYMTIGDGGNIEGLADNFTDPQPDYSAFREASFGHAVLEIKNRTHAYYTWHRNDDGLPVAADSLWIYNRYFFPKDENESSN